MVQQQNTIINTVYYQMNTNNKSFLDMHYFMKNKGIVNNAFHLLLLDPELERIDPRDPTLSAHYKGRILNEVLSNYWYFIREIVRIPAEGESAGDGVRYKLHRGNLALNFGFINNWNMFLELPRQQGKTVSILCRLLWEFNFCSRNSEIMFINKKHEDAKMNLRRLKNIRKVLPAYLRFSDITNIDGSKKKVADRQETLEHPLNFNRVVTLPSARNKILANQLGRGCTQPRQWYDEFAFIPHIKDVYMSATPAYKTASLNAKRNNAPYGILISTTPGDLTTEEGQTANVIRNNAIKFDEGFYDKSPSELYTMISENDTSNFIYMRFTYQQLGLSEEWLRSLIIELQRDWPTIRREILLEWSTVSDNSPFSKEDLNTVKGLIREPIHTEYIGSKLYQLYIYDTVDFRDPPIIGVDVSGGYYKDSSAITIIDSRTTNVIACLNCNYISPGDLAMVVQEIVIKYMPNAIVNVERNGGFGASVISYLMKTTIKRNLYFEIKDRVMEERYDGVHTVKQKQRIKVYGLDSTKKVRDMLIELLRQRMELHKNKFISPIIYHELETLEVKRSGKVEHSDNGHDDQIFSYLIALYVWYEGQNLVENWGLQKRTIKCDDNADEEIFNPMIEEVIDISDCIDDNEQVKSQMEYLQSDKTSLYNEWEQSQKQSDDKALQMLLNSSKVARQAYNAKYHTVYEDGSAGMFTMPDSVFMDNDEAINNAYNPYNIMDDSAMYQRMMGM